MSNYITRTTQVVVLLEDHAPTTRHDDGCDPGAAEDVEPEGGI